MSFILSLFLTFNLGTAFASNVNWTSVKTCSDGYDLLKMESWGTSFTTKYILKLSNESYKSLLGQLNQNLRLNANEEELLRSFEVSTPSYGKFEADLSFGKVIAQEYENGTKVVIKIYNAGEKEISNYYFNRCY